jgi:uncharacterized protein YjiK
MIQETCASHVSIIYSLEVINWSHNSTFVVQATKRQQATLTVMTSDKQTTLSHISNHFHHCNVADLT